MSVVLGGDSGLTLIEVMVSLLIFAIIAVGVAYSLASTVNLTRDARSREVAINLAAEVIDSARSVEDIFDVTGEPGDPPVVSRTVGGVMYRVYREAEWVTSNNVDAQCGANSGVSAGGSIEYKRVNVTVTWDGMRAGSTPVRSDTLIAPNVRINDETKGTILVSVQLASGAGAENLTVTATPSATTGNTAQAITVPILPTDEQGCTYILRVVAGSYNVSINKTGWVDDSQNNPTTKVVSVTAGGSITAGFQYDQAATYVLNYGAAVSPVRKATNNMVTFVNTYGDKTFTNPAAGGTPLHPFSVGYQAIAGDPTTPTTQNNGCLSPDPANWPTRASDGAVGVRSASATAAPGLTVTAPVAMGMVNIGTFSSKWITAVAEPTAPGTDDPGCALAGSNAIKYTFGQISSSSNVVIALPFGSWKIYSSTSSGSLGSALSGPVPVSPTDVVHSSVVTLDPRQVIP